MRLILQGLRVLIYTEFVLPQEGGIVNHLTYEERILIQQWLKEGRSIADIANNLSRNRSTISREIKKYRVKIDGGYKRNVCIYRYECDIYENCGYDDCDYPKKCASCHKCNLHCEYFLEEICLRLEEPPYVCNACNSNCDLQRWIYNAKAAQTESMYRKSEGHSGITISHEDMVFLTTKVVPLLKKGVSVSAICRHYEGLMPISSKTLYDYIDKGLLDVNNLDLRLKVRRRYRKKKGPILRVDKNCHVGRSYSDYLQYMEANPDLSVCQMDSVIGRPGGKAVLSIYFTNCGVQLYFLRDRNTATSVTQTFSWLRELLGDDFSRLFQVILTDRGSEFTDPKSIEIDQETGEIQCNVFYCEPMNSNQKSHCERNHELFRYIAPKGRGFDNLTHEDILKATNHINSYPRRKWNWQSPIDIFEKIYGTETLKKLGLERIPFENLNLREDLLR